jgi:hypothetical protein
MSVEIVFEAQTTVKLVDFLKQSIVVSLRAKRDELKPFAKHRDFTLGQLQVRRDTDDKRAQIRSRRGRGRRRGPQTG